MKRRIILLVLIPVLIAGCKILWDKDLTKTANDSDEEINYRPLTLEDAIKYGNVATYIMSYNNQWPEGYNSTKFFEIIRGNKNLTDISFCYVNIDSLPPSIGTLSNLKSLQMQSSGITKIPPEISKLKKLVKLDLGNSRDECMGSPVTYISPKIGKCESLEILNLAFSKVTTLPNSLHNCKRLRTVDLSFNFEMSDSTFNELKLQYPDVKFIRKMEF